MGYVTLSFLGEEYEIPEAAKEYLEYAGYVEEILAPLFDMVASNMERDSELGSGSWMEHAQEDVDNYRAKMREVADLLVDVLISKGIYDVSLETLVGDISTFQDIEDFALCCGSKAAKGAKDIFKKHQRGLDSAYSSAVNEISGPGLCIFSSSLLSLADFAVVEGGVLLSQAKKADASFEKAANELRHTAVNEIDKLLLRIMVEDYYPKIPLFFVDYYNQLMSRFFVELSCHGEFDFDSVESYSMRDAEDMLTNIDRVPDKEFLLKKCFQTCPFCKEVYEKCAVLGLMDDGTRNTAKYFGFNNLVCDDDLQVSSLDSPSADCEADVDFVSNVAECEGEDADPEVFSFGCAESEHDEIEQVEYPDNTSPHVESPDQNPESLTSEGFDDSACANAAETSYAKSSVLSDSDSEKKRRRKVYIAMAIAVVAIVGFAILFATTCWHEEWIPATCTEPKTCADCGKTEGDPLGHDWVVISDEFQECLRCGDVTRNYSDNAGDDFTDSMKPYLKYLGTMPVDGSVSIPSSLLNRRESIKVCGIQGTVSYQCVDDPFLLNGESVELVGICEWKSNETVTDFEYDAILERLRYEFDSIGADETGDTEYSDDVDMIVWDDEDFVSRVALFRYGNKAIVRWSLNDNARTLARAQGDSEAEKLISETKESFEPRLSLIGTKLEKEKYSEQYKIPEVSGTVDLLGISGKIEYQNNDDEIEIMKWRSKGSMSVREYQAFLDLLREYFGSDGKAEDDDKYSLTWKDIEQESLIAYCDYDSGEVSVIWRIKDSSSI